ncbi:hypothetical protein BSKO_06095 [Bryopsis sp. KO-2023]|nr:hypothetical protein BSKO_06095 [Bryopsis sp. KO-2023]
MSGGKSAGCGGDRVELGEKKSRPKKTRGERDSVAKGRLERLSAFVNNGLVVAVCCLLTILGLAAFFNLHREEMDAERLYTPSDAQSFKDREYVDSMFGHSSVQDRIIIAGREGQNLLDKNAAKSNLLSFMELWEGIENQTIHYEGQPVRLMDICYRPMESLPCRLYSILDAWDYNKTLLEEDNDVLGTINSDVKDSFGISINKELVLWGLEKQGETISGAEVFLLAIDLHHDLERIGGASQDPRVRAWDNELVDSIVNRWDHPHLRGYVSNFRAVDIESNIALNSDIKFLGLAFLLIVIYSHVVLFRNSPIYCKSQLALVSVISVLMSITTAFGLALFLRVAMNSVVKSLIFLLLGLGMDDTFVIMGSYFSTDENLPVEERMGLTMMNAGSSILVTSVTDFLAFCVGTFTKMPSVQVFCLYAAIGIFFDFLYQVTFFVAFVAWDARREERCRRGAVAGASKPPPKKLDSKSAKSCSSSEDAALGFPIPSFGVSKGIRWTEKFGSPSVNHIPSGIDDSARSIKPIGEPTDFPEPSNNQNLKKIVSNRPAVPNKKLFGKGAYDPKAKTLAARLVGDWLPNILLNPWGTSGALLIEIALLGLAVQGCSKVYMDFQYRDWFTPEGSWLHSAFEIEDKFFHGEQNPFGIFTREPADGKPYFEHQDALIKLAQEIRNDPYVAPLPDVVSWYEVYSDWLVESTHAHELVDFRAPNVTAFNEWLMEFLLTPDGRQFMPDVRFDPQGSKIIATRIDGYTRNIKDGSYAIRCVDSLRETASRAAPELDPVAYHFMFLYIDGFRIMKWETIRNVIIGGVAVFAVTLLVLANVSAALLVVLMVALTDVMLLGFMWYADLTFNPVTSINVVIALGIAVDYSAHVAHSFLVAEGSNRQRVQESLSKIGVEVFNGGFTTGLAMLALLAARHYVFRVFCKMMLVIIVAGLWHGLVVLPVLLSIVGPKSYSATNR